MKKVVFIRHGESVWNKENLFTGWADIGLTERGELDALNAGKLLKESGYSFDVAYTSVLKRAIKTLHNVLDSMNELWIPEYKTWLLNERHYGALQGLNKAETAAEYGEKQVAIWRRSYDVLPPLLADDDNRLPENEEKYRHVPTEMLPRGESLKETVARVVPFWKRAILPELSNDKHIIIAAHGNSLRALVKYIDNISDEAITSLNIPTAVPLVYEFSDDLQPVRHYYLGDQAAIAAAVSAVQRQGTADVAGQSR